MYISKEGKKLYSYYKQYDVDFFLFLERAKKSGKEEDIHDFRVSIKKIKGIYKLLDLLVEEFDAVERLNPFKKLFKPAGKIRECQVNLKRLIEYTNQDEVFNQFKKHQQKSIKKKRIDFNEQIQIFQTESLTKTRKTIKKYCRIFSKDMILKKVFAFMEERKASIKMLALDKTNEEGIHLIRIKLKEISTVLGLLSVLSIDDVQDKTLRKLKKYEDLMGLWHDRVILRTALKKFNSTLTLYSPEIINLIVEIEKDEQEFINNLDLYLKKVFKILRAPILSLSDML